MCVSRRVNSLFGTLSVLRLLWRASVYPLLCLVGVAQELYPVPVLVGGCSIKSTLPPCCVSQLPLPWLVSFGIQDAV